MDPGRLLDPNANFANTGLALVTLFKVPERAFKLGGSMGIARGPTAGSAAGYASVYPPLPPSPHHRTRLLRFLRSKVNPEMLVFSRFALQR